MWLSTYLWLRKKRVTTLNICLFQNEKLISQIYQFYWGFHHRLYFLWIFEDSVFHMESQKWTLSKTFNFTYKSTILFGFYMNYAVINLSWNLQKDQFKIVFFNKFWKFLPHFYAELQIALYGWFLWGKSMDTSPKMGLITCLGFINGK